MSRQTLFRNRVLFFSIASGLFLAASSAAVCAGVGNVSGIVASIGLFVMFVVMAGVCAPDEGIS